MLEENPMEEIKTAQNFLNKKRRLIAKMDRLRKAKAGKVQAWQRYRENMAKTLREEQEKYEKDIESLNKTIEITQQEIDSFGDGPEEEMEEVDTLENMLQNPETVRLKAELANAQARQQEMCAAMRQMQEQMKEYQSKMTSGPMPSGTAETTAEMVKEAAKEAERIARLARMKKVEDQLYKDRERSPRRESQDSSQGLHDLG